MHTQPHSLDYVTFSEIKGKSIWIYGTLSSGALYILRPYILILHPQRQEQRHPRRNHVPEIIAVIIQLETLSY